MMRIYNLLKKHQEKLFLIAGMLTPAFAILVHPQIFHPDDLNDFLRWSQSWSMDWRNIYINCQLCNYPFLGVLFSGGAASLLGVDNYDQMIGLFRYYLAFIDLLNVYVMYLLLKKLGNANPGFWSGIIGLLPSSWIGTSYWGQIDNVGQLLILLIFLCVASFNLEVNRSVWRSRAFVIAFGLLLSCLLMSKQLVLFSMISLGAMAFVNIYLISRKWIVRLGLLILFAASFVLPVFLIDRLIFIPPPYLSHLQYILTTGSHHGDVISSYGFNLWSLFVLDPLTSSHDLLSISILRLINFKVVPFNAGLVLYSICILILMMISFFYLRRKYINGQLQFQVEDIVFWLLHLGLVNLTFNLFLSGTHERYLYHFYPFVILAFLSLPFIKRLTMNMVFAGAVFYGSFLFSYLIGFNQMFGRLIFNGLAVFHLLLLILISQVFIKHIWMMREKFSDFSAKR